MSINWVMLSSREGFVPLQGEQRLFVSPPRVSLDISSVQKYPMSQPFQTSCSAGRVHLTNKRIVYISSSPSSNTTQQQSNESSNDQPPKHVSSFSAPLTNLHDSHTTSPWLGPNAWVCLAQPVPGGGIPTSHPVVEIKMTFRDGGAFDWHSKFCEVKERLATMRQDLGGDTTRSGPRAGRGAGLDGVDANLEQLPAYEERPSGTAPLPTGLGTQRPNDTTVRSTQEESRSHEGQSEDLLTGDSPSPPPTQAQTSPAPVPSVPQDPPPGYEEVQRSSVAQALESAERERDG